ncbi:MAG: hypothetical protein WC773_00200 [Patescibacteria group bacterium]|jgi:hypothetical protein
MVKNLPLWSFAVLGLSLVLGISFYVKNQFNQSIISENSSYEAIAAEDAPVASTQQKKLIDQWITANDLNTYGDPKWVVYSSGPLKKDGGLNKYTDRYIYIIDKHPDAPWNTVTN